MKIFKRLYVAIGILSLLVFFKLGYFDKFHRSKSNPTSKYVWCMGFAHNCDITFSGKKKSLHRYMRPERIKTGDLVWVESQSLPKFYAEYLDKIQNPFILVLTHGDESFPSHFEKKIDVNRLIEDSRIIHIFAQNCDYKGSSSKVSHLPIGLDLHTMENNEEGAFGENQTSAKEQEQKLEKILANLKPTYLRIKRAYVDFQLNDTMRVHNQMNLVFHEDRETIFKKIMSSGVIDVNSGRIPRSELWKKKGEYAFSICPPGNGYDTHRAWEDLILGCIVIVKSSPLNPLYKGLPVVIVNDWSEVSEENFSKWLQMYGDAFTNPKYRERLSHKYWMNKIDQKRVESLSSSSKF
ncbi:MAG: hypothetical protein NTX49_04865 [Chlamydiae bacterium]|nr:hypothetical protein [Chlamydiota bacterium]